MEVEIAGNHGDAAMGHPVDDTNEEGVKEVEDEKQEEVKDTKKKPKGKRVGRTILSGRGVTLKMLVDDGILDVEEGCMSIDYLGQKFVADLLSSGKIKWEGSDKLFNSPSAWAIHCKKLVNPSKNSGCGWASVKYKGKKLDQFKMTWFRKQRPLFDSSKTPSPSSTSVKKTDIPSPVVSPPAKNETTTRISPPSTDHLPPPLTPVTNQGKQGRNSGAHATKVANQPSAKRELSQKLKNKAQRQSRKERSQESQRKNTASAPAVKEREGHTHEATPPQASKPDVAGISTFNSARKTKLVSWPRSSVNFSELRQDSDPQTLVQCVNFANLKKTQPFIVSINTNTLMLMDLHCHLTTSEVVGYLGGHWHKETHQLQIVQAFPVKCRFADQKNAESVEEEIRTAMEECNLVVVGWYHSHPTYQPDPSLQDIATQQHHQKCLKVENSQHEPCVGFIVSPYDPHLSPRDSVVKAYWIQSTDAANTQSSGYPLPMVINYSIQQSGLLTDDLLTEMRQICYYYKGSPDAVNVTETWLAGVTFLDKIKASLMKTYPKDQSNRLNCFINMLLS